MKVPFFDRTRADAAIEPELTAAFSRVVRSGKYILGEEVTSLERCLAAYLGARHAVAVSSGTDALLAALMALEIGPGDEVICPAYSFFATAEAIVRLGASPVFVDVSPATLTIDPRCAAQRVGPRTKAILAVHLFGRCADIGGLRSACSSIPIVEDAAQAFGSRSGEKKAGVLGTLGCFSFFPTKNLGGFGDGGLVVTDDEVLANRVTLVRNHGARSKNHHQIIGGNFRLDALQAALIAVKLARVDEALVRRRTIGDLYRAELASAGLLEHLLPLELAEGDAENQFVVRLRVSDRDVLRARLAERGIGTEVYYPRALHHQPCFSAMPDARERFPVSELAAHETLALPMFPELRDEEIRYVVLAVRAFFDSGSRSKRDRSGAIERSR